MTVEVDRDALLAAVRRVVDVVSSRETLPILRNILLRAEGGRLTVTGTNLDLQASATVSASGEIATTIDASKMLAAVDGLPPGALSLAPVKDRAAVAMKRGRSVRTLGTLPATDFPIRPPLEGGVAFPIASTMLVRLLETTAVAHGADHRAFLAGAYLHPVDGRLRAVATDGFRVVRCDCPAPDGAEDMPGIIIPTKAVALIRKLLGKVEAEVRFAASARAFELEAGAFRVHGQLVDATYPEYNRIIPAAGAHALTAPRDAILSPAASVAAVVDPEGERKVRPVAFTLAPGGEHEVAAQDPAGTHATEPMDCDYEGTGIRFGVDSRYLATVGAIFAESGRLTIAIEDPSKAMRLTGDKDPDLIAVIGSWAI